MNARNNYLFYEHEHMFPWPVFVSLNDQQISFYYNYNEVKQNNSNL